jgi:hypothetical protein
MNLDETAVFQVATEVLGDTSLNSEYGLRDVALWQKEVFVGKLTRALKAHP